MVNRRGRARVCAALPSAARVPPRDHASLGVDLGPSKETPEVGRYGLLRVAGALVRVLLPLARLGGDPVCIDKADSGVDDVAALVMNQEATARGQREQEPKEAHAITVSPLHRRCREHRARNPRALDPSLLW